jgi:serine/threonine protein kinase
MANQSIEQLGEKYVLLDLIGIGGMAEVHKAKLLGQQGFEKLIVIKKLLAQVAGDREIVENFIAEAKLAALLQHENIAYIYDFGELEGSFFIAMEYLFGKDLFTIFRRSAENNTPLSPHQSLTIAAKICAGMNYAHNLKDYQQRPLKIIHRDLTPHNIFLTYDGKVKIIDFGVAKAELSDNRTQIGMVKGKVSYMSPEQLGEQELDNRSDIFSIGILLYEMLSGQKLYQGDTATLIKKCINADFIPLQEVVPDLPEDLYAILDKALRKKREERYQSCGEMAADINECLYKSIGRDKAQPLDDFLTGIFSQEYEDEKQKDSSTGTQVSATVDEKTVIRPAAGVSVEDSLPDSRVQWVREIAAVQWLRCRIYCMKNPGRVAAIAAAVSLIFITILLGRENNQDVRVAPNVSQESVTDKATQQNIKKQPLPEPEIIIVRAPLVKAPPGKLILQQAPAPEPEIVDPKQIIIRSTLREAEKAIRELRLTSPEQNSAYNFYREVLELDPENNIAKDGIRLIGEKYAELAEKSLQKRAYKTARKQLTIGLTVVPDSERLKSIAEKIQAHRKGVIESLNDKAQAALSRNHLTTPESNCAYKYFKDILVLEPKNQSALKGLTLIGDRYHAMGEKAFMDFNLQKARTYVQKGLSVAPNHRDLLELERDLTKSKVGIFFRTLEKSVKPIFK